ncbi:HPr kinase/phosphatase C-terminal domain-containing protein [Sneathiella limimaris]|uniref:HPr kinase/phosphatase C-terminal domain-containing protein n=1 Tax=Sneathiella limimaris TaxID=1964213 RepID=UPI00146E434D
MIKQHASVVAIDRKAILIRGPSGAGKSDLALQLIGSGARLVSDDYVELQALNGRLWAHTPEQLKGMMEVRGLGVIKNLAYVSGVQVTLCCDLVPCAEIDRFPDPPLTTCFENIDIALMNLDPSYRSNGNRIRLALDRLSQIWPSLD